MDSRMDPDRCESIGEITGIEDTPALEFDSQTQMADPWKHRSIVMKCNTCMWFANKAPSPTLGRCRRRAPVMGGYPAVFATDWCGDHKIDENKV